MTMLITFEGIEGSGKTTQIKLLGEYLHKKEISFLVTREPGGTVIGNKIRKILLDSQNSRIVPFAELLLYAASRSQHVHEVIYPAIKKGLVVICDRFTDATLVYQGVARGLDLQFIKNLNRMATKDMAPHLTLLLDCPVEVGLLRAVARINSRQEGAKEDRIENEDFSFHQKVREGYLAIAHEEPDRVVVLEGMQDENSIHQEICRIISEKISDKFRG